MQRCPYSIAMFSLHEPSVSHKRIFTKCISPMRPLCTFSKVKHTMASVCLVYRTQCGTTVCADDTRIDTCAVSSQIPTHVFPLFGQGPVRQDWIRADTCAVSHRIPTDVFPLFGGGPLRQDWIRANTCAVSSRISTDVSPLFWVGPVRQDWIVAQTCTYALSPRQVHFWPSGGLVNVCCSVPDSVSHQTLIATSDAEFLICLG